MRGKAFGGFYSFVDHFEFFSYITGMRNICVLYVRAVFADERGRVITVVFDWVVVRGARCSVVQKLIMQCV